MKFEKVEEVERLLLKNRESEIEKKIKQEQANAFIEAMVRNSSKFDKEVQAKYLTSLDANVGLTAIGIEANNEAYLSGYRDGIEDFIDVMRISEGGLVMKNKDMKIDFNITGSVSADNTARNELIDSDLVLAPYYVKELEKKHKQALNLLSQHGLSIENKPQGNMKNEPKLDTYGTIKEILDNARVVK